MWIAFLILAILAIIIAIILLLPVKVIIKNDENDALILRYKLLFKTYGENPNPDDPIVQALTKAGGVDRFRKKNIQRNIQSEGLQKTVSDSYTALIDLLKELLGLLKKCTIIKLDVRILCADSDPSKAAINYGIYNAVTHTLLGALHSLVRIRRRKVNVDIRCVFDTQPSSFRYEAVLAVPFFRVVAAFWRAAVAEAKRTAKQSPQQK